MLTKITALVQRHTHNVQFITMCSHNMFSIIQYYMWYEFEINKTFLVNLYNEKHDFTLTQVSKPTKHPPEQNLPYA